MQKRIEPVEFHPAQQGNPDTSQEGNKSWVAIVIATLILVAMYGVFVWLPTQVDSNDPIIIQTKQPLSTLTQVQAAGRASSQPSTQNSELSPFEQAQLEKARKEAQDILEQILLQQEVLQEAKIALWGQVPYEVALASAQQGDQHYRDRDFASAIAGYSDALAQLTQLTDSIPALATAAAIRATDAIEIFEELDAQKQLALLEALAPNHNDIVTLTERIEALPSVAQLFASARQSQSQANWNDAKIAIDAAAKADPKHQAVNLAQTEIQAAWQEAMFEETLGRAYAAIADNEFGIAAGLIQEANAFKGSNEALNQAKATLTLAETSATLRRLEQEANIAIEQEDWQGVINVYREALDVDPSIQFAQQGLPLAQSRLQLDQEIDAVLNAPERLQDRAVAAASERLLDRALTVTPAGPALTLQIQTLRNLIDNANRVVDVRIESDGLTHLTLLRHSNIGPTQGHQTRLRPGKYTLRGTRVGYRDILVNFEIKPEDKDLRVFAACSEQI